MSDLVTWTKQDNIGVVTIDNPPVNALAVGVRAGILKCMEEANADASVEAIVLTCAGRTFIAGADITEFGKPPQEPGLMAPLDALESSSKAVVAAIHGTALGGGLEVALACHYRVAVHSAKLGFPEVLLGLIPGAAGTQRLPRITGPEHALKMITSGVPIDAGEAAERGLLDEVIEGDLVEGAVAFAKKVVSENRPLAKVRDLNDKVSNVDSSIFDATRAKLAKSKRNFEAPQACVDAVEAACTLPFDEGLAKEQELFFGLMMGAQSASQRHIFFAERAAAKINDMPKDVKPQPVKHAAVLGAGTMGGGIAMNLANAGIPTYIYEISQENLDRGMKICQRNYDNTMKKGRMNKEQVDACMALIKPTLDMNDFADVDFVIEAVFEEMDIKKDIFTKLDAICKDGCVLATNTSTLDVDEIANVTKRPEWVLGTHFFSPANVMKLLEVVRGEKTNHQSLATTLALAKAIKKVPVTVGVCDGFVGNRMVHKYGAEAAFLLEDGCLPQDIDGAIYAWGMAMGPLAMGDLAGLDVGWRIRKGKPRPEGKRYSAIADKICEMGRYGQKTGSGYYQYEEGSRTPLPDPEINELILAESKELGIERRDIGAEEIVERTIYHLVNEGAKILEEGIAQRASDIDVIYVYGYGFPVHRGGPMFYADTVGLKNVYETICRFDAEAEDDRWAPAPLLKKLAEEGGTFN
jgi:3-hydroxyacyl-CoA dehydrogenase